jgi:NADPH-ferrihemoprotein reductase
LKYVVFGLGNKTYEHYNAIARIVDRELEKAGAIRIGERGEGDDDKSMEEDYLEWKDGMWDAFAKALGVEEGQGSDTADFVVNELESHPEEKVYLGSSFLADDGLSLHAHENIIGELSARALTRSKGIHDAKNPYPAPITVARELFDVDADRNCVHMELGIEGSGISYQHGDHVGVWPSNPDIEVDRLLCALGLYDKKDSVIGVESLDPALAKVPFPVPTTYLTVLRHYIDIMAVASRQFLGAFAKYAPTPAAEEWIKTLATDKEQYAKVVGNGCLKLAEVLQLVTGTDISVPPTKENTTAWHVPFDLIVSSIPRLQPRYYSISSSPKLHPNSIHITCVILKYESLHHDKVPSRWVYGVGSNFLLNLKHAANEDHVTLVTAANASAHQHVPRYSIEGPRSLYKADNIYKSPIHVRRSTFRLPTNPKTPVIMIGPGTGVAPFRGFVQERIAMARRTIDKNGVEGLNDWGKIYLYFGCRNSKKDFLYKEEWPEYEKELHGKFVMRTAFSREPPYKPDGGKFYVQDLMREDKAVLSDAILTGKAYVYVCGDGKSMSKGVEDVLMKMLGEARGGSAEKEGAAELKLLKERSRYLTDVWS